ncbi:UNVERIFIED_CONTAM: hypothetical protein GTU68_005069, partial [Idotea baltica]|nr:hypothetical protein [Idotea baltica]
MKLYNVYPLYQVTPISACGTRIIDDQGKEYLDFYGGHAVISIGHSHPHYIKKISQQLSKMGFYSNSVLNPLQEELSELLAEVSGLSDYQLFLCNSGAEANENALKLASFHRPNFKKVIAFKNGFHGRTSAAVNVTDNPKIQSTFNQQLDVAFFNYNQEAEVLAEINKGDSCAIILEVIQGVGGLDMLRNEFLKQISKACQKTNTVLIVDEVQSGYGRSGKFFAFQLAGIEPDIVSMAKGMGNGFPVGGILINEKFKPTHGQLGTTFGGNHLACAASIAVLEIIKEEGLIAKVDEKHRKLSNALSTLHGVNRIKGAGLMLGAEFNFPVKEL